MRWARAAAWTRPAGFRWIPPARPGLSHEFRAGLRARVYAEFGRDALCVMSCGVGTNGQCSGDGGIRPALRDEGGYFHLSCRKPILHLNQRGLAQSGPVTSIPVLPAQFLQLAPQVTHLPKGHAKLIDQNLAILPEAANVYRRWVRRSVETPVGSSDSLLRRLDLCAPNSPDFVLHRLALPAS